MHRAVRPVVVMLVIAALTLLLASCGSDDAIEVAKGEVLLEAADSQGRASFTEEPYAGVEEDAAAEETAAAVDAFADVAEAADATAGDEDDAAKLRTVRGGEPGLYGGSDDNARCDRELLLDYLEANPDKALAWVRAFREDADLRWLDTDSVEHRRLSRDDIEEFLGGLTPLVLTVDTRVTNHGYEDGRAVPLQSVLQAGTAVLVDVWGVPRVRCACGNPLNPPEAVKGKVSYTGKQWKWFSPRTTINVIQSTTVIDIFVVRDPDDPDKAIEQPAGAEPEEGEPGGDFDGEDVGHDDGEGAHDESGDDHPDDEGADDADAELGAEESIIETGNIGGVRNGGSPVSFTVDVPTMITSISNYHWNDAQGAAPGKIILKSASGELMGSWAVTTLPGQGGVPNAYWVAEPGLIIEAGTYVVTDTSMETWATNDEAGGQGMTTVTGRPVVEPH